MEFVQEGLLSRGTKSILYVRGRDAQGVLSPNDRERRFWGEASQDRGGYGRGHNGSLGVGR